MSKPTRRAAKGRRSAKKKVAKSASVATPPKPLDEVNGAELCLSVRQYAAASGHDRTTVTKRISELEIAPAGMRNGHPVYRLRDLIEMERKGEDGKHDPDKMSPFERQAHFKAESERLKVDQERGTLMRREDVERDWARVVNVVAMELEIIVDEIERDVGAPPLVLEKIEAKIDVIRERMCEGVSLLQPAMPNVPEASDADSSAIQ